MKRNIGIITFHTQFNYGSALQAYALVTALHKLDFDAQIIDYFHGPNMEHYRLFRTGVYKKSIRSLGKDILYFSYNWERRKRFLEFQKKNLPIMTKRFHSGKDDLSCLNRDFDTFICGSDQIWNMNCLGEFVPEYFLSFAEDDKKKIAYAPSMPCAMPEVYHRRLRDSIERLDAVSVREYQTVEFLRNLVGVEKEITHVVDPTLLLDAKVYIDSFGLTRNNQKYIFVYILSDDNTELIKYVAAVAKKTGLPIKYVAPRKIHSFTNAEYALAMGPVEFLDAVYNASYVITNSFHATVFSVHFHVPMCVFSRTGSESRMVELLDKLEMRDNLYTPGSERWMQSKADNHTDLLRKALALESLKYLKQSLEWKARGEEELDSNE